MKARGHTKILAVVTAAWAAFWVAGLPEYYQQYSFTSMLVFDVVVLVALSLVVLWVLTRTPGRYRMSLSLWLAFYISVPLMLYDYLYCGVYLEHGWSFVWRYWYLSVYYVIPWILCPTIGYALDCRDRRGGLDQRMETSATRNPAD